MKPIMALLLFHATILAYQGIGQTGNPTATILPQPYGTKSVLNLSTSTGWENNSTPIASNENPE